MLDDSVSRWFMENAMAPMFQLAEFAKATGVGFTVDGGKVTFDKQSSIHPLALAVDGKTLLIGKWTEVSDEVPAVLSSEYVVSKESAKSIKQLSSMTEKKYNG